jgi:tRNA(Arg) A34 adenosine deaminase TadA
MHPDQRYLHRAVELAASSAAMGGFPSGALVVLDGAVLGEGVCRSRNSADPTAHAEICAIRAASLKRGTRPLAGATLYSALEPCLMCLHAASWAGVARIVYGAEKAGLQPVYYEGRGALLEANRVLDRPILLEFRPGFSERIMVLLGEWEKGAGRLG